MNKTTRAIAGVALLAVSGLAAATTITTTVDAKKNSIVGGIAADAFTLMADTTFTVTASGIWQNDPNNLYQSGPDGHIGNAYSVDGATFDIGALIGEIGNGPLFKIGSSYSGSTGAGGELKLFYWDSDAFNNSGTVSAVVSSIPEPTNVGLLALALGAFALTRRRKA
jgi:hypothetical protein